MAKQKHKIGELILYVFANNQKEPILGIISKVDKADEIFYVDWCDGIQNCRYTYREIVWMKASLAERFPTYKA